MNLKETSAYRSDIDGMRAIAVVAVIFFHAGFLPNGYLGVDMFFVISGFLITGIIYRGIIADKFSIFDFYDRRIRRIIPLATFISLVALVIGIFVMLPDDLENLAESVVATSFFGNNILQAITTRNYWDVVNEYKPLMHTWSLAIEEQYYFLYPFLFLLLRKRKKLFLPAIILLATLSYILFLMPFEHYQKFYYLPFRFFELATGGVLAIIMNKKVVVYRFTVIPIILIFLLFYVDLSFLSNELLITLTVLLSAIILGSANSVSPISKAIMENKVFIYIGRISYSLYMWHQLLFAFGRYFVFENLTLGPTFILVALTFILSALTYEFIEQPFRNRHKFSIKPILLGLGIVLFAINTVSLKLYFDAGVYKDIPELGIKKDDVMRNMHAKYNDRVFEYDVDFEENGKLNVLVLGNSFARDWVNVLLESDYAQNINISYIYREHVFAEKTFQRAQMADVVFYSEANPDLVEEMKIPEEKLWVIGTKNFGFNNGIFYNSPKNGYCQQRTNIVEEVIERNIKLSSTWGSRYIDLLEPFQDEDGKMPVFNKDCEFMSQDCRHLTQGGAKSYAEYFTKSTDFILYKLLNNTSTVETASK